LFHSPSPHHAMTSGIVWGTVREVRESESACLIATGRDPSDRFPRQTDSRPQRAKERPTLTDEPTAPFSRQRDAAVRRQGD
jgi:hypothetical protein